MSLTAKQLQAYHGRDLQWLHGKAEYWFNRFVRLRDCDDNGYVQQGCMSTGQVLKWPKYHAGHYFAAGNYRSLRYHEDNVHAQSVKANYYGHGDLAPYRIRLVRKIGEERMKALELLSEMDKKARPMDRFAVIEVIEKYKSKCKQLAKDKNFKA